MDLVNPRIDEYAEQSTTRWPPDIAETLAFIDADKTGYPAYLDAPLPKLSEHGLIVADNMLRDGAVLEADPDESTGPPSTTTTARRQTRPWSACC